MYIQFRKKNVFDDDMDDHIPYSYHIDEVNPKHS